MKIVSNKLQNFRSFILPTIMLVATSYFYAFYILLIAIFITVFQMAYYASNIGKINE